MAHISADFSGGDTSPATMRVKEDNSWMSASPPRQSAPATAAASAQSQLDPTNATNSSFGGQLLNTATDPYIMVSDDADSRSTREHDDAEDDKMKVEPDSAPPAPPLPQTLPTASVPATTSTTSPPMAPPPVVMIRYTEVIDHPHFHYQELLKVYYDCIHHEMTTRLQVRLPFVTSKNRARRLSSGMGLGLRYNSDNNVVEVCYHDTRRATQQDHDSKEGNTPTPPATPQARRTSRSSTSRSSASSFTSSKP